MLAAQTVLAAQNAASYYAATTRRSSTPQPAAPSQPRPRMPVRSASMPDSHERHMREEARRIAVHILKARARSVTTSGKKLFMGTPNLQREVSTELYDDEDEHAFLSQLPMSCSHVKLEEDELEPQLPTVDFLEFATPQIA